jgi:hypothetical protein
MPIVSRVYAIPPEQVKLQKHRVIAGVITLFVGVPLSTALVGFCFLGGHQSLSAQEMVSGWAHNRLRSLVVPNIHIEIASHRTRR